MLTRSSSSRAFDWRVLRAREVHRRDGGLVPRLVVVQRLLRQQLALEQVPRTLDVGLCEPQVRFALPDGRTRDLHRRLGLPDLLLQLLVFDLGEALAAADPVAELHVDLFEPAGRARHDRDGGVANQVADDDQLLLDGIASCNGHVNGQRPTEPAAAAPAATGPPPPPPRAARLRRGRLL